MNISLSYNDNDLGFTVNADMGGELSDADIHALANFIKTLPSFIANFQSGNPVNLIGVYKTVTLSVTDPI